MSRTFQDEDLVEWEAFASTGKHGFPDGPLIVFNCMTDRTVRPRVVRMAGDETDAQRKLEIASEKDLLDLLNRAEALK
jgi:hypothetical protein